MKDVYRDIGGGTGIESIVAAGGVGIEGIPFPVSPMGS